MRDRPFTSARTTQSSGAASAQSVGTVDVLVDGNSLAQSIDGFGVAGGQIALTSTYADNLFTLGSGCIGLTFLRVQIDSDGAAPEGYNSDMYVISDPVAAVARGAKIIMGPWSALPAYKDNGSWVGGNLLFAHYGDHAARQVAYINDLKNNHGVSIYAVEIQNEPDDNVGGDSSMFMTSTVMTGYLPVLGAALAAAAVTPRIILPTVEQWSAAWAYVSSALADSSARPYVDIVGIHQYSGVDAPGSTQRPIWQTEMSYFTPFDASMTQGMIVANDIHLALTTGLASAWLWWWATGATTDNEGLRGQSNGTTDTKRFYVLGQWSRFVRPGYTRVNLSSGVVGVSLTAFKNLTTGAFVIVAINTNVTPTTIQVQLNALYTSAVVQWITSATLNLSQQSTIPVVNQAMVLVLPATSVSSFVST